MISEYLHWHYGVAWKKLRSIVFNFMLFVYHYFSVPLLFRTLFAPYKRTYKMKESPGFSLSDISDRLTFNIVSRLMGALVRSFVIGIGLMGIVVVFKIGLACLLLWPFFIVFSFPIYFSSRNTKISVPTGAAQHPQTLMQQACTSLWGQFFLGRLNIPISAVVAHTEQTIQLPVSGTGSMLPSQLFFAFFDQSPTLQQLFFQHGCSRADLENVDAWYLRVRQNEYRERAFWERDYLLHIPSIGKRWTYGYTPILDRFTVDLSKEHAHYISIEGRKNEIESLERILVQRSASNVMLVGEPTVGKHSLLIHFGHLLDQGRVVPELESKRLLKLDLERLFSVEVDAIQRKSTLSYVLKEARAAGNIILVIDEFDRFVSSGSDRIDVSDIFAHANGKGLHVIAIVLPGPYHQYIQPNKTISPLFELLEIRALTKEETFPVVCDVLSARETSTTYFLYDALRELISDADRLLKDVPFPEKAITVIDQLITLKKSITVADVQAYFTRTTHVPIALASEERKRLLNLEKIVHERIIAQDEAVSMVSQALRRTRSRVSHQRDKPIGTFLFLGPTGVGKTETAKALAQVYFGNEASLIRFDMSEFQDASAIKQFLGDFQTGRVGVFSQKISQNPYTVLLLDEIEKANKNILNIFLPALDEGYITDAFGKKLYLTNMIIIATSNAGSEYIREQSMKAPEALSPKMVLDYVQQQAIFSPEFVNRFDSVVVFHPLDERQASEIINLQLTKLKNSIFAEQGIHVDIAPETKAKLLKQGFDQAYGGRALSRAIQTIVEEPLAEKVLKQEVVRGGSVVI